MGGQALAVKANLALETDILALFKVYDEHFGPLYALVNNAGVLEHQMRLETMSFSRLQQVGTSNNRSERPAADLRSGCVRRVR